MLVADWWAGRCCARGILVHSSSRVGHPRWLLLQLYLLLRTDGQLLGTDGQLLGACSSQSCKQRLLGHWS